MVSRPGEEEFLDVRNDATDLGALTSSRSVGGMFSLEFNGDENNRKLVLAGLLMLPILFH